MSDIEDVTLSSDLPPEAAAEEINSAVSARHKIARRYVARLRRRNPEATPADIIAILEKHYVTAIALAGGVVTVGTIAANVGIALIPGVAAGKEAGKGAAKVAAKTATKTVASKAATAATKTAVKGAALSAAKSSAERAVLLLPAGDEQIQFEITAIFALAIAEIHDMKLDQPQAHALIYGLSNGRVSQQQIATMATDLAQTERADSDVATRIVSGHEDWSHWANTLADTLPGGAAQDLVRTIQTGHLETVRSTLNGKQQSTIEYGVGAVVGGVTRFVFGREVIEASRQAFPPAPETFPDHLGNAVSTPTDDSDEPNRALRALEEAAKSTGSWVTSAAHKTSRPFRRVDLDGDGIPDTPKALTAAKGMGSAIAGAVSTGTRAFRRADADDASDDASADDFDVEDDDVEGDRAPEERHPLSALKGATAGLTARLTRGSKETPERPSEDDLSSDDPVE